MIHFIRLSLLSVSLVLTVQILAAPGDLDLTFNGTGKSVVGFGLTNDEIRATAIQPDGKVITAGNADSTIAVVRFNVDGSPDNTFGKHGKVIPPSSSIENCSAVIVQPDGKIIIGGFSATSADIDFTLIRFNPDGSFDTTFGTNGIVKTSFGILSDSISTLVLQPDGKIFAAGFTQSNGASSIAAARYNVDGTLDLTFDDDGKATYLFGDGNNFINSSAIQPDGKIVLVGNVNVKDNSDFFVVRINQDGSPDTSFDGDGIVQTAIDVFNDGALAVAVQPNGKIVAGGISENGLDFDFAIVRYNSNGSVDTTFGNQGFVTIQLGPENDILFSIALQTDGKIVAAGSTFSGKSNDFALVRYLPDGRLDVSFENDGIIITPASENDDSVSSLAVQSDGRIIAAGSSLKGTSTDFTVIRYLQNGAVDDSFASNGFLFFDVSDKFASARASVIQPDGKIVLAGINDNAINFNFALARYNPDGTLDNTFGINGKVSTERRLFSDVAAAALQTDGHILVAGTVFNEFRNSFAVARYTTDGTLDISFGENGFAIIPVGGNNDLASSLVIQPNGSILVGGASNTQEKNRFSLIRLTFFGSLDTSFNGTGKIEIPVGAVEDISRSIGLQPDGKIILAGSSAINFTASNVSLVRINPNGSLDNSFDGDGKVTTFINNRSNVISSLTVQPDGKILGVGSSRFYLEGDILLVRYNPNGSLDTSFDGDGKVITSLGSGVDSAFSAVLQSDGKIIVGGESFITPFNSAFAVVRYLPNGSLDISFESSGENLSKTWGNGGKVFIDFTDGVDIAFSVKPDSLGRIVVAGEAGGLFGVARLSSDAAATANLGGRVVNQKGRGISGANLTLTFPNGLTRQIISDNFGRFTFNDLPAGDTYRISIRLSGYRFEQNSINFQLTQNFDGLRFVGLRF
jgi:uncharacterized delta-60 repeat protein